MTNQYVSSPFKIFRGNDLSPKFTYKLNGVAQDIKTAKLTFVLCVSQYDTTVLFTRKNTAAGGDDTEISWVGIGDDGEFYVHLIPANTKDLEHGTYWWEIQLILGGETTTIGQNKLEIKETMIS